MEPMWSPEPVVGYRVWAVMRDRVKGVRAVWRTPRFEATCSNTAAGALPHVDHACGVHAVKDPALLTRGFPGIAQQYHPEADSRRSPTPAVAVGTVALSGRVVEHTRGYRAQIAQVTRLVARNRRGVFRFDDPAHIEALFADPHVVLGALRHGEDRSALDVLSDQGGRTWT